MLRTKLVIIVLALLVFSAQTRPQTQPSDPTPTPANSADADKRAREIQQRVLQMLDQSISDAGALRLSQNKAIVFAISGDLYWRFDEKHARDLFRSAASELINYNAETEREQADSSNQFNPPDPSSDVRSQILGIVAGHDPELALQMLQQTRSAKLAEAMARSAGQTQVGNPRGAVRAANGPGGQRGNASEIQMTAQVQAENALEQQLATLAAANDPDAAAKMIKDAISKGVTPNVLSLLQNLFKKDDKRANDLGGEVVNAVVADDMSNMQDLNVALNFLQFSMPTPSPSPVVTTGLDVSTTTAPPKQFAFTDSQVRDLVNKVVSTLTSATPSPQTTNMITRALPTIQKLAPEKVALLNQKLAESQKTQPKNARGQQQAMRVFDRNSSAEDILAQLPSLTTDAEKRMAYQSIANKAAQIKDDDARAQKLIDQIGDDSIRANAQQQFNAAQANRAAAAGKIDDARKMIATITDRRTRMQRMVALALTVQKNGTDKDLETARAIMKEARSQVKEIPEDEDDIADLMDVVRGYATVDPDTAFRMAEPVFDIFNETLQAAATLSKYNKRDRTFKKGELVLRMNGGGGFGGGFGGAGNGVMLFRFIGQIQALGRADLERTSAIADRFTRGDARTIVRLYVLQGFLSKDKKTSAPAPAPAAPAPGTN